LATDRKISTIATGTTKNRFNNLRKFFILGYR
jgi:hypothetical protein